MTGAPRNAVLFEWENGCQPEIGTDLRLCFRNLGAITAQMHAHSRKWQQPEGFERFAWNFETALGETPRWGRWRDGLGIRWRGALSEYQARAIDWLIDFAESRSGCRRSRRISMTANRTIKGYGRQLRWQNRGWASRSEASRRSCARRRRGLTRRRSPPFAERHRCYFDAFPSARYQLKPLPAESSVSISPKT